MKVKQPCAWKKYAYQYIVVVVVVFPLNCGVWSLNLFKGKSRN